MYYLKVMQKKKTKTCISVQYKGGYPTGIADHNHTSTKFVRVLLGCFKSAPLSFSLSLTWRGWSKLVLETTRAKLFMAGSLNLNLIRPKERVSCSLCFLFTRCSSGSQPLPACVHLGSLFPWTVPLHVCTTVCYCYKWQRIYLFSAITQLLLMHP